jgi:hypothetical protein
MLIKESQIRSIIRHLLLEVSEYKLGTTVELGKFTSPPNAGLIVVGKESTGISGVDMYFVLRDSTSKFNQSYFKSNPGQYQIASANDIQKAFKLNNDDETFLYSSDDAYKGELYKQAPSLKNLVLKAKKGMIAKTMLGSKSLGRSSEISYEDKSLVDLISEFNIPIKQKGFEGWIDDYNRAKKEFPKTFFFLELADLSGITSWPELGKTIEERYDPARKNAPTKSEDVELALNMFFSLPIGLLFTLSGGRLTLKALNSASKQLQRVGSKRSVPWIVQAIKDVIAASDSYAKLLRSPEFLKKILINLGESLGIKKAALINFTNKITPIIWKTATTMDTFIYRFGERLFTMFALDNMKDYITQTGAEFLSSEPMIKEYEKRYGDFREVLKTALAYGERKTPITLKNLMNAQTKRM